MNNMENMIINASFRFNNNNYLLLVNDKCSRFYLKLEDNKTDYLTLDEYKDIKTALFSPKPLIKYNKIAINSLIKLKKELVSLSIASSMLLSLSGCSTGLEKTTNGLSDIGIETSMINDDNDMYKITKVDLSDETVYANVNFSAFSNTPFSVKCTPGNFDNYIGKSNVSFDDLRIAVKNNKNIPDDIGATIIEAINNLESANFNMNYSVLEYNLSKLKIEYIDPQGLYDGIAAGSFDPISSTIAINKKVKEEDPQYYKSTLIHEIIGHGATTAYDNENKIFCNVSESYLQIDKNGAIVDVYDYGGFGSEGIADTITSIALNKKINRNLSGYSTQIYELTTLCSSVGIIIEDYANYGVEYLTNKMIEQGIDNPYQIITSLDNTVMLYQENALIQSNNTDLFFDYYKELSENGADIENLKESTTIYSNYVDTETVNGSTAVLEMLDDDTLDFIYPEKVTEYVNNLEKVKSH